MRIFHIPRHRIGHKAPAFSTPWGEGHASPEDRALGYELELIELERRRGEVADGSVEAAELEQEIAAVRHELTQVAVLPDLKHVA